MALPSSGAIRIGQYCRELLVRSTPYSSTATTKYITLNMNNTYFRYINGATTDVSQISMSSGYGKYGLPKSARLSLPVATNLGYSLTGLQFVNGPDNSIYVVGTYSDPTFTPTRTFGWVAKLTNTAAGGTAVAWGKYITTAAAADSTQITAMRYVDGLLVCTAYMSSLSTIGKFLVLNASDGSINYQIDMYNNSGFPLFTDINRSSVDGAYFITGYGSVSSQGTDALIFKINSSYNYIRLSGFGAHISTQVFFKSTLNGTNIASVGYTTHAAGGDKGLVVVSDLDGNVVWWKYLTSPDGTSTSHRLASVAFDNSGYVNVVGFWTVSGVERAFIARFDTAGNILWAKSVGTGSYGSPNRYTGITFNTTDGFLYVSGYTLVNGMMITAVYNPADGTLLRFRVRNTTNTGPGSDFFYGERGDPQFDTQGNVVYLGRHDSGSSMKGILFIREKIYSDTSAGLREALGSQTSPDPDAEFILDTSTSVRVTTIETTQTVPPFLSYYSFFTFIDLTVGTNIQVAQDTLSGYNFISGTNFTTVSARTVSDRSLYANSQYYAA